MYTVPVNVPVACRVDGADDVVAAVVPLMIVEGILVTIMLLDQSFYLDDQNFRNWLARLLEKYDSQINAKIPLISKIDFAGCDNSLQHPTSYRQVGTRQSD